MAEYDEVLRLKILAKGEAEKADARAVMLESLHAKIDELLSDLAYHEVAEGEVVDVRTPSGWRDVASYFEEEK